MLWNSTRQSTPTDWTSPVRQRTQRSFAHDAFRSMSIFHFLLSDEADKRDNGEAAANQALPSLCHWIQVRSFDFSRQKQGEKLTMSTPAANVQIFFLCWDVSGSSVIIWPCLFRVTGRESTQTSPTRCNFIIRNIITNRLETLF